MGKSPGIVFLDDNEDLRELMPAILKATLDVDCLAYGSLTEFQNHPDDVLHASVAILDINLGNDVPDGIDAYHWLRDHGFGGKVLFLTGHARTSPQVALAETKGAEVLEKPLHPDQLMLFIRRALSEAP
jgi:DNA-binding NtrC family response regulator